VLNITGRTKAALHHTAVLGLSVRRDWRGRGVGNALLAAGTAEVAAAGVLQRVEQRVYTTNLPAVHLYEKYCFQREGCARHAVFQRGRYYGDYVMGWLVSAGDDTEARS
jgi:putative acetyltransferase